MNLLKADLYRLFKDKALYILLALMFLMPLLTCLMFSDMTVENVIFQGLDTTIMCSFMGIMVALFVGKDYSDNTIRNKICYGEKRFKIMGVTFFESVLICLMFIIVSFISSFIFGSIFGKFNFSSDFFAKLVCQILILLAFAIVVASITMCTKSVKIGLAITLLISLVLSSIAQILPLLSVTNQAANFFSRIIYSTVSSNLLNSVNGTYVYTAYTSVGSASVTFNHLYLNSILVAFIYALIAVIVTFLVVRKQSYK